MVGYGGILSLKQQQTALLSDHSLIWERELGFNMKFYVSGICSSRISPFSV